MRGTVEIIQGSGAVVQSNELHPHLFGFFSSRLNATPNKALDDLFDSVEVQGGDNTGRDGILYLSEGVWRTLPTFSATPSNNSARRCQAVWTPAETINIERFQIGHNLKEVPAAQDQFETVYANVFLEQTLTYFQNVPVRINWEINLRTAL